MKKIRVIIEMTVAVLLVVLSFFLLVIMEKYMPEEKESIYYKETGINSIAGENTSQTKASKAAKLETGDFEEGIDLWNEPGDITKIKDYDFIKRELEADIEILIPEEFKPLEEVSVSGNTYYNNQSGYIYINNAKYKAESGVEMQINACWKYDASYVNRLRLCSFHYTPTEIQEFDGNVYDNLKVISDFFNEVFTEEENLRYFVQQYPYYRAMIYNGEENNSVAEYDENYVYIHFYYTALAKFMADVEKTEGRNNTGLAEYVDIAYLMQEYDTETHAAYNDSGCILNIVSRNEDNAEVLKASFSFNSISGYFDGFYLPPSSG